MTKEHILREIKRTAESNGGNPLGKDRFSRDTGIKMHHWNRFWARWGDALREAGFKPNTLQRAYTKDELLEKYALFVRELGRLPSSSDLRLKSHSSPDFPGRTIEVRLRPKDTLAKRIADHFANRSGFEDVVLLCQQVAPPSAQPIADPKAADAEMGYVYLSKSGRFYKIGKTNSVGRREYELGIQLPEKVTTIHVITTDDPAGIEAYWHKRFEAKRKKGEWFLLTAADVSAFKKRSFM
jgi:hypothetical protein